MSLLLQHIEKIILGAVLIALLAFLSLTLRDLRQTSQQVNPMKSRIELPTGSLPEISADSFQGERLLAAPGLVWTKAGDEDAPSLFDPARYIVCANPECRRILRYDAKDCTKCGHPQDEGGGADSPDPDQPEPDDEDRDGLPREYEDQFDFLDDRLGVDARRDSDGDLFTNIEEYRAGTSPEDEGSHPPLAKKMRFVHVKKHPLPIRLYEVKTYGKTSKDEWDLFIETDVGKGERQRVRIFSVGETLMDGRFEIADATVKRIPFFDESTNSERTRQESTVVLRETEDDSTLVLEKGQQPPSRDLYVSLIFLSHPTDIEKCRRMTKKVGNTIDLPPGADNGEQYRVQFDEENDAPALLPVDNGKATGGAIPVPRFVEQRDLRRHRTSSGPPQPNEPSRSDRTRTSQPW